MMVPLISVSHFTCHMYFTYLSMMVPLISVSHFTCHMYFTYLSMMVPLISVSEFAGHVGGSGVGRATFNPPAGLAQYPVAHYGTSPWQQVE